MHTDCMGKKSICKIIQTTGSLNKKFGGDSVSLLAYDSVLTITKSLDDVAFGSIFNISDFSPTSGLRKQIGEAIKDNTQNATLYGSSVRLLNKLIIELIFKWFLFIGRNKIQR